MASNGIQIAAFALAIIGTIIAFFATSKSINPKTFDGNFNFKKLQILIKQF